MKLFIDDIRTPYDDTWLLAVNTKEANELLDEYNFDAISFDNDLGYDGPEGIHVLQRLEEEWVMKNRPKPSEIRVHTANPVARDRMDRLLVANGYKKVGIMYFNRSDMARVYRLG